MLKNDLLIGGIDEAGRGSVIGPLIIAGITIRQSKINDFIQYGIKDSKMLTRHARENLFNFIINSAQAVCIHKIDCLEIDNSVYLKKLNQLEARAMALVIENLDADAYYIDSCDINPLRYRETISNHLICNAQIYSMHYADRLNAVVSAASIVAKVIRDHELQTIRSIHPDIGSGYPSDKKTIKFIREWVLSYKDLPEFVRKSWKPVRSMIVQVNQSKLV